MIPKIIHYCWFGGNQMPRLAIKCIDSWRKFLPDYKLYLWNEETFDVYSNTYTKEAYSARKFAFVADFVRLHAISDVGGIYLDTDVELIKSFDPLLNLCAFSGFETEKEITTAVMASEPNGAWAKEQIRYYQDRKFIKFDGKPDLTTNVEIISKMMARNGLSLNNRFQIYNNSVHVFPKDYFCPKSHTGIITITKNTYCIHHFSGSWQPVSLKISKFFFQKILGPRITDFLVKSKKKLICISKQF